MVNDPVIIVDPETSNWALGLILLILINPLLLPEPWMWRSGVVPSAFLPA